MLIWWCYRGQICKNLWVDLFCKVFSDIGLYRVLIFLHKEHYDRFWFKAVRWQQGGREQIETRGYFGQKWKNLFLWDNLAFLDYFWLHSLFRLGRWSWFQQNFVDGCSFGEFWLICWLANNCAVGSRDGWSVCSFNFMGKLVKSARMDGGWNLLVIMIWWMFVVTLELIWEDVSKEVDVIFSWFLCKLIGTNFVE